MEIEEIDNNIELLRIFSYLRPIGKQYDIYTINEKRKDSCG